MPKLCAQRRLIELNSGHFWQPPGCSIAPEYFTALQDQQCPVLPIPFSPVSDVIETKDEPENDADEISGLANPDDDEDFIGSHMCCDCGGGETDPNFWGVPCTDTDNGNVDTFGYGCEYYSQRPSECG